MMMVMGKGGCWLRFGVRRLLGLLIGFKGEGESGTVSDLGRGVC